MFLFVVIVAGGVREELQRAFLLHRFRGDLGQPWMGVFITSLAFGLGHTLQGLDAAIITGALGALWGVIYLVRGSAVAPMVSHSLFNSGELLRVSSLIGELDSDPAEAGIREHRHCARITTSVRRRSSDTQSAISSRAPRRDQPLADDRRRLLEGLPGLVELGALPAYAAATSASVGVLADAKRCARYACVRRSSRTHARSRPR